LSVMKCHLAFLALVCLGSVQAELTQEELNAFRNDGGCGGSVSVTEDGDNYIVESNGLPDHYWQCTNPNEPQAVNYRFVVPKNPDISGVPYCLGLGATGIAKNGVAFFSPVTVEIMNAVEGDTEETFDDCVAHPTASGAYHYHQLPKSDTCNKPLYDASNPRSQFLGIAIDGVPIVSQWEGLDAATLDVCHGTTLNGRYVYVAVEGHYPYLMGCYRARPDSQHTASQFRCQPEGSGKMCLCERQTGARWATKCDITCGTAECGACSRKKRTIEMEEITYQGRSKRSPRFHYYSRRDIDSDQCHDPSDTIYENGNCPVPPGRGPPPGGPPGGPPAGGRPPPRG